MPSSRVPLYLVTEQTTAMRWSPAATATPATPSSPTTSVPRRLLPLRREPPQRPHENNTRVTSGRRSLMLLLLPISVSLPSVSSPAAASPLPEGVAALELYTDKAEGFTLLRPSSWIKVEKAGATALFEEEGKGINNIGIVVSPVRLDSLKDFGTPQLVADKLIQAERRKESTKEAEVITASERSGHGGLPVYEFEYTVDSTRGGVKRIFSAAFVASKKLYLLNIQHSDQPENPLDSETITVLEQVLHSFCLAS